MATFIATLRFTPQGLAAISETTKRAAAFRNMAKKSGVKVTATYWTLGTYDGLLILEAPDDATVTSVLVELAALGNVQTSTARAYSPTEMEKILAR